MHSNTPTQNVMPFSLFNQEDIRRFQQGTHYELYQKMGSHQIKVNNIEGMCFAVWAPAAKAVFVMGNFNAWQHHSHPLIARRDESGIWEGFIPGLGTGEMYKYHIITSMGIEMDKGDPFAHYWEVRPATASITCLMDYQWQDEQWLQTRQKHNSHEAPWSVYEVNLLSWMRPNKYDENSVNTYQQAIALLVPYVKEMGFTHVELMPVMEYPNDASWGYQGTGFFAPTSRFGTPTEFMNLIDAFHQAGIGVILDWVPSHFPYDAHGLYMFDGTHTYEHADMRRGYHPDWHSYIFDYGKPEVKSFLISSARFWIDVFHADGLRVDGVSSMLILSYSRAEGQWEPNAAGEDKNLEAIAFLQDLNTSIPKDFPGIQIIAEESTAWQGVTSPVTEGGLGFGMKWMMGWMHDTLEFFQLPAQERKKQQEKFRLSMEYYYSEKFMLALSHDEVVYGKQAMINKMPGVEKERFANLRLLYAYMFTHPGAKLLFMGDEFASTEEWNYKSELPWGSLQYEPHRTMQHFIKDLNGLLRTEPALYELQFDRKGFEWVDTEHADDNVFIYRRMGKLPANDLLIILNLDEQEKKDWKLDAAAEAKWSVLFSSADQKYGGSGIQIDFNAAEINLPPLSAIIFKQV